MSAEGISEVRISQQALEDRQDLLYAVIIHLAKWAVEIVTWIDEQTKELVFLWSEDSAWNPDNLKFLKELQARERAIREKS